MFVLRKILTATLRSTWLKDNSSILFSVFLVICFFKLEKQSPRMRIAIVCCRHETVTDVYELAERIERYGDV